MFVLCAFMFGKLETIKSLDKVGVSDDEVRRCIWNSFSGGYLSLPPTAKLKLVLASDRAAAVRDIVAYAKNYSKSEEFKKNYLEYREQKKPSPPEKPKSVAEMRKEQKAQLQQGLKEAQENVKKAPAEQKEIFKGVIDMYKEQLKQVDDPNNPMFTKDMDAMMQQGYAMQLDAHKQQVAEWEQQYPPNSSWMVRKWLQEFLQVSSDVDFGAALKDGKEGKKVFVNSAYEAKSDKWKMCYRAGKETVETGRDEAQKWLKEFGDGAK